MSTLSNTNIHGISRSFAIKFYLQQLGERLHWIWPDWIRTLVSMATDSSHRVIMGGGGGGEGQNCGHSSAFIFDWIFFILAGKEDNHKSSDEFEIRPDPTTDFLAVYKIDISTFLGCYLSDPCR